jgi:hypothetical protein
MPSPIAATRFAARSERTTAISTPVAIRKMTPLRSARKRATSYPSSEPGRRYRTTSAMAGVASRLSWLMIPYSAMPDVAARIGTSQPRRTTHSTPMFHGPIGTLAPMPDRIR